MPSAVTYIQGFLVYAGPLLAFALKVGLIVGLIGSTIEAGGMLLNKVDNPRAQSVGAFLVHFGKALEAWGADVPKFVTNAGAWVSKFAKLFGTAAIFLFVCAIQLGARL